MFFKTITLFVLLFKYSTVRTLKDDFSMNSNIATNIGPKTNISNMVNVTNSLKFNVFNKTKKISESELIQILTAPNKYDRLEIPNLILNSSGFSDPVKVYVRLYIYVLQNIESSVLQFKVQGLIQIRYVDSRLVYDQNCLKNPKPISSEADLRNLIWVPHIYLANDQDSSILGTNGKDILTSIAPDGTVVISSNIQATLFCWMDLRKFPFDEQKCSTVLESLKYNASELILIWEENTPLIFDSRMHLTEYVLQSIWNNNSIVGTDGTVGSTFGTFNGNYSCLNVTVYLTRESGFYIIEYFLPSIMIVAISWVSFWLQADQTPARTTLGTSTLLTIITLASSRKNNLPKVSYIKVSEVWFLGCTAFIFGSLIEFAFVNTIWRRTRCFNLKKKSGKHILKSTLSSSKLYKSQVDTKQIEKRNLPQPCHNCITAFPVLKNTEITSKNFNKLHNGTEADRFSLDSENTCEIMTPQEVSLWIDRKARFIFPLTFLLFNAIFWSFVYCL